VAVRPGQDGVESSGSLGMAVTRHVIEVAGVRREQYGHQGGGYRHGTVNSVEPPRSGSRRRRDDSGRDVRLLRAGGRSLRLAPWPADGRTAQLSIVPGDVAPTRATLRAALQEAAAAGYAAAVTAALGSAERPAFTEVGFEPLAWLHLLERDLGDVPAPPADGPELRRVRRSDWSVVATVDSRAFPPFWHLGKAGIAEARHATPSNRVRVAVSATGTITGFAVCGRSGARGFLQRLAVEPDAQGRGIGTTLALDGLRWMQSRAATSVLVNTQVDNERALALYRRLGFRLLDEKLAVLGRSLGGVA
jgi:ribosomal protein S18 acetylase RimI-like enzyme